MTDTPTGRHRLGRGTHRASPGRHRPVEGRARPRRWPGAVRAVAVVGVAGVVVGVGPSLAPVVDGSADRPSSTPSVARDGVPETGTDLSTGASPDVSPDPGADADAGAGAGAGVQGRSGSERERSRSPRRAPRPVPEVGDGTFRVAPGEGEVEAEATYGGLTYTVEVEDGVPFGTRPTARLVERVLDDPRGWEPVTGQDLRRTGGDTDFRVLVASPATTDLLCAPLATNGEVSCRNGDLVVLNADRWATGVPDYEGHLRQYRTYLVNHEVGHRLGFGHVECVAPGGPAPVMQQQTYGLDGCTRNAWPSV